MIPRERGAAWIPPADWNATRVRGDPVEDGVPCWRGRDRTNCREVSSPQFAHSLSARDEALLSAEEFSQPVRVTYHTVAGPGSAV